MAPGIKGSSLWEVRMAGSLVLKGSQGCVLTPCVALIVQVPFKLRLLMSLKNIVWNLGINHRCGDAGRTGVERRHGDSLRSVVSPGRQPWVWPASSWCGRLQSQCVSTDEVLLRSLPDIPVVLYIWWHITSLSRMARYWCFIHVEHHQEPAINTGRPLGLLLLTWQWRDCLWQLSMSGERSQPHLWVIMTTHRSMRPP